MPVLKSYMTKTKRDKKKIFTTERLKIHARNMYLAECMVSVQKLRYSRSMFVFPSLGSLLYLRIRMVCF